LEDLIIPVQGADLAAIEKSSEFSLRRKLYFAKESRIVKINDALLYTKQKFKVSLPGNIVVFAEPITIEEAPFGIITWRGILVPSDSARFEIARQSGKPVTEKFYRQVFGFLATITEWDRSNLTGAVRPVMYRPVSVSFDRPLPNAVDANTEWSDFEPNAFRTVSAKITIPAINKTFRIESLEDNMPYHLLYEENEVRYSVRRFDGPIDESTPEGKRDKERQLAYEAFLRKLEKEENERKAAAENNE